MEDRSPLFAVPRTWMHRDDSKVLNIQGKDQKLVMKLRSLLRGGQVAKNFQSVKDTLKVLTVSFTV